MSKHEKKEIFLDYQEAKRALQKQLNNSIDYLKNDILTKKDMIKVQMKKKRKIDKDLSKKEIQISFF